MKEGFADSLLSNDITYEESNGSLYVTIPEDKVGCYIELAKEFLCSGSWNEVLGTVWTFIFDDGIREWDSVESGQAILNHCKTIAPNVSQKRTLMEMLWGCEFYHDVLYHDQYGTMIHSKEFTGTAADIAIQKVTAWLAEQNLGCKAVNYKLRDWLFSRQRYWGEPFPILHLEDGRVIALDESQLPLELPSLEDYKPSESGEPPLAKATDWVNVTLPDGTKARRETNTMPQWAGSCWYYLRYMDPKNDTAAVDFEKQKYWLPIDLYIGGAEHAVLHLLYSRFWHKLLHDLGYVSTQEPYQKLINQGMILGSDNQKMSKSRGNVINPDDVVNQYGADSMRLYEMFMGPLEATKPWSMNGVEGVHRFLQRAWRMIIDTETGGVLDCIKETQADEATLRILHQTIKKVTEDVEGFAFNTAISQMMIFVNHMSKQDIRAKDAIEKFVLDLAPFAPHMCEELWQKLGHTESASYEPWPAFDESLAKEKEIELAIQIKGKTKDKITVAAGASEEQIKELALASEKVQAVMNGKEPKKIIVIKSRLVNIVV